MEALEESCYPVSELSAHPRDSSFEVEGSSLNRRHALPGESASLFLSFGSLVGSDSELGEAEPFSLADSSHLLSPFKNACRIGTLLWKLVSSCCT